MIKSIQQMLQSRLTGAVSASLAVTCLALHVPAATAQSASQQQPQLQALESVAAVVNDKVISTFDVRQRIQLIALTSGGQIPQEAMAQVQQKAVQDLVEEQLKLAEAAELEFDVDPEAVEQELAGIAAQSGGTVEQLEAELLASGITPETLRRQIRSRIVWQQLVNARYGNRINITDAEIDAVMTRLKAESRDEQYLVAELCLPVREGTNMQQIEQAGMQILNQLQQGVPFETMARQFSVCTSAANGGDLGWLRAGELDPELGNILRQMGEGSVSRPIPHEGTMKILAVRQIRAAAQQGEKGYELAYASAPLEMSEAEVRETFAKLPQSNICTGDRLTVDLGEDIGYELLPMLPASRLQAPFRGPVEALERGDVSAPIRNGNAWHGMLLCSKDEGLGLPSRAQVEDRLYAQELELISRRYLRDVERESSVQIRLGTPDNQAG